MAKSHQTKGKSLDCVVKQWNPVLQDVKDAEGVGVTRQTEHRKILQCFQKNRTIGTLTFTLFLHLSYM